MFKSLKKILIVLIFSPFLGACSNFFEKDNAPAPAPLPAYTNQVRPYLRWSTHVGGSGDENLRMQQAIGYDALYTASSGGMITAIFKSNGNTKWRTKTRLPITTGPGIGDGIVVVGARHGEVLALRELTGEILWQNSVPGEVLAQPAIQDHIVIIKSVNGYVRALSVADGHEIWSYQETEPNLILRGASTPKIQQGHVFVGFASGRLYNFGLRSGDIHWRQSVATPEGGFAIQRMIDIDANPVIDGRKIYAATYQGNVASLDWSTGDIRWSNKLSSYTGMDVNSSDLYISDANSYIWAFDASNGHHLWEQKDLYARDITAPIVIGNYLIVGDGQGYLHVLNKHTGNFVGRSRLDHSGMMASPLAENNVLYVLSKNGLLASYIIG